MKERTRQSRGKCAQYHQFCSDNLYKEIAKKEDIIVIMMQTRKKKNEAATDTIRTSQYLEGVKQCDAQCIVVLLESCLELFVCRQSLLHCTGKL
jgi:hypothetical protein